MDGARKTYLPLFLSSQRLIISPPQCGHSLYRAVESDANCASVRTGCSHRAAPGEPAARVYERGRRLGGAFCLCLRLATGKMANGAAGRRRGSRASRSRPPAREKQCTGCSSVQLQPAHRKAESDLSSSLRAQRSQPTHCFFCPAGQHSNGPIRGPGRLDPHRAVPLPPATESRSRATDPPPPPQTAQHRASQPGKNCEKSTDHCRIIIDGSVF